MMKNAKVPFIILVLIIMVGSSSFNRGNNITNKGTVQQDTTFTYKDGTYSGQSRASYTEEPYWGQVLITVKKGYFTSINFMVRDSNLHETFDANYEKHFEGNPEYIQQTRKDWKGVQTYPKKLAKTQDINKVDATTGATWSYNIFKASITEALKNAK